MKLLIGGDTNCGVSDFIEKDKAKCMVMKYNWHNDVMMFFNLVVPKLDERENIIHVIHEDIGHFNKQYTLIEVKKRYLWHDRIKLVRKAIRKCKHCHMVK
jgi:hypothetical protein